ncbi:MAG: thioredoxin-dependent thiol peroxidase [Candidatus Omnitrophica bacterium]|nr:thioredoxin-dependent thiol peroxidase [Candidatus Omnitrophota bacterium]
MALIEGKPAPDFKLPSTSGKDVLLSDFKKKKNVVLYFYPKDDTPGCTQEACDFRDSLKQVSRYKAEVFGVSADSLVAHQKFQKKYGLPFELLSDEGKDAIQKYGVWKEKSMYGRKYMGIERTTFVINQKGKIVKIFPKVKVTGHIEQVLEVLKGLS